MDKQLNKSTGDESKQNKGWDERMRSSNTTKQHSPCEDIKDHEHRITILESTQKQQGKDIKKLDLGLWEMLNTIDGKVDDISLRLARIGVVNGNQDKAIECLEKDYKEKKRDKKQNWRTLRDLVIGSVLTFIFLVILTYVLPSFLK